MILGSIAGNTKNHLVFHTVCRTPFSLALVTGAATPLMMWIFQGVMNNLISLDTVHSNSSSSSHSNEWYDDVIFLYRYDIFHLDISF